MDRGLGFGNSKGAARRLFIDLNERPEEEETVDPNDQPKPKGTTNSSYVDRAFHKQRDSVTLRFKITSVELSTE